MKRLLFIPLAIAAVMAFANPAPTLAAKHDHCTMACNHCAEKCEDAAKKMSKKKNMGKLIKQLEDCAKACRVHEKAGKDDATCMEQCKACAEACEKTNMAELKDCIKACLACADCCSPK